MVESSLYGHPKNPYPTKNATSLPKYSFPNTIGNQHLSYNQLNMRNLSLSYRQLNTQVQHLSRN